MIIDFRSVFDQAANEYWLLDHPFYRAWVAGELTMEDLGDYAGQYRHVEQALPATLEATAALLPFGESRRLVEDNLADERSRPRPHMELLEDFAASVGADTIKALSPATAALVSTYQSAAQAGPVAALAVIGAYEVQAGEVASTKAASLRSQYRLGAVATQFWDIHAQLEDSHANWTAEALDELNASPADVYRYAAASAEAWWSFLDEREASRQVPSALAYRYQGRSCPSQRRIPQRDSRSQQVRHNPSVAAWR
jgi:pyrroloquinoline-quinone synthase